MVFWIAPSIRKKGLLFQTKETSCTTFKSQAEVINKDAPKFQLYKLSEYLKEVQDGKDLLKIYPTENEHIEGLFLCI